MRVEEYTEKNKNIEENLLLFLENEDSSEEYYSILIDIIDKFLDDKYELALFLHLISKISKYHHRNHNFISNIERILRTYEKDIKKNFTNSEIFKIFKGSKRILLFLFEEKIITIDKFIFQNINTVNFINACYIEYFAPELKSHMNEDWIPEHIKCSLKKEIPENFNELRKEGENENYICKLIRNDSIKDFIVYVNKNNYSLHSTIPISIYETNTFIIKKMYRYNDDGNYENEEEEENGLTLIEYATFFGSIQIFKYLQLNGVELTSKLWIFAIYSNNAEIIHLLEENSIKPINGSEKNEDENQYKECIKESIKCHHNDIVNYFLDNYFQIDYIKSNEFFYYCIKFYNFSMIQNELINEDTFFYICKYDYFTLVNLLSNNTNFNINSNVEKAALVVAVENNNIDIVKLLLTNDKLDVNILSKSTTTSSSEKTALFAAVENENVEIVKLLLTNDKLDVNILSKSSSFKKTALFAAIDKNNVEIVKLLLANKNNDLNILNTTKIKKDYEQIAIEKTALHLAIEKANIEIFKLLFVYEKFDINILCKKHEHMHTYKKDIEEELPILYIAINQYNKLSDSKSQKIIIEIVKLLLTIEKLDINIPLKRHHYSEEEVPILYFAIERMNFEIVKLLLTNENININHIHLNDMTKSNMLKIEDDSKEEDFYTDYYDNYYKYEESPLFVAIQNKDLNIVKLLLSYDNLDINFVNKSEQLCLGCGQSRMTALYAAIVYANAEIVKYLLTRKNIDPNIILKSVLYDSSDRKSYSIKYKSEKTALSLAVEKKNIKIVKLLLTIESLNINIPFCKKDTFYDEDLEYRIETPLYLAINNNNNEIVKLLLNNNKLDINFINTCSHINEGTSKKTSFYCAVQRNDIEIVKLMLMNNKLDINTKNIISGFRSFKNTLGYISYHGIEEKTALFEAIENGNIDIIILLFSHDKIDVNFTYKIDRFESIKNSRNKKIFEMNLFQFLIYSNKQEIIQLLLSKKFHKLFEKIDVNRKSLFSIINKNEIDIFGKTPLYEAVEKNNINAIKALMSRKDIDINEKSFHINNCSSMTEKTALDLAVEIGNPEILSCF